MSTYLSNKALRGRGLDACAPGFEIVITRDGALAIRFWDFAFKTGQIIDRVDGQKAARQSVARITAEGEGFTYQTTPGPKGAIRYGWAPTENAALDLASAWVRRRFAHCTPVPAEARA